MPPLVSDSYHGWQDVGRRPLHHTQVHCWFKLESWNCIWNLKISNMNMCSSTAMKYLSGAVKVKVTNYVKKDVWVSFIKVPSVFTGWLPYFRPDFAVFNFSIGPVFIFYFPPRWCYLGFSQCWDIFPPFWFLLWQRESALAPGGRYNARQTMDR